MEEGKNYILCSREDADLLLITDRILALCVLVERRREFQQGMLAAYVYLKKAFDSVHRKTLWDLLHLRGIPARIIGLLTGLYSGTVSAVKCRGGVSASCLLICV